MYQSMLYRVLAIVFVLTFAASTAVLAAPIEITVSYKAALDKIIAKADSTQAGKIRSQYERLMELQKIRINLETQIKALHKENSAAYTEISKRTREIDADKVAKLKAEAEQTRESYKPLFEHSAASNKQIEAARPLKNKELNALLRFQADALKIPLQLAREDIKYKDARYSEAKKAAAQTISTVRTALKKAEPLKEQIKSAQAAVRTAEKRSSAELSSFKASVKAAEPSLTLSSLTALVSFSQQVNKEREKELELEGKIRDVYIKAEALIP